MGRYTQFFLITALVTVIISPSALVGAQYYPLSQFNVNVTINVPNAGSVYPGSGLHYSGETIVYSVYTYPGFSFDGWYVNGVYQGKLSSIPLTMTQDYQLTASFSKRVALLTVSVNPAIGGNTAPGSGVWNYTYGDSVIVKQFPNSGSTFEGWYLDGVYQGLGTSITVTMNGDHQLNAFFSGSQTQEPTPISTPVTTPVPTVEPSSYLPHPDLEFFCYSSTTTSGFNVKIQGSLAYNNTAMSGAGILLSYSVTGGATWQDLAFVTTDNYGSFSAVWMPSASGQYLIKAVWPSDYVLSSASKTVNFAVTPSDTSDQSMFSVASNSTLTQLSFNSANQELSFSVSGPSTTTGYVQVCVPISLLPDTSTLKVTVDDHITNYNAYLQNGNIWIITIIYGHSSHTIRLALDSESVPTQPTSNNNGSIGDIFSNQMFLIAIIGGLVAVIVVLIVLNRRKTKSE